MQSLTKETYSTTKAKATKPRNYQERSVPKFLKKVFQILEDNKHNDLVSWNNEGVAVVIKKPTEFAEKVLPLYFKHNNFASFIRQLNMYKFKKKKNYQYDHVYVHDMFQHGRIDLLRNIQRKSTDLPYLEPVEFKTMKEDVEVDVDNLIQENLHYKRIHKTLSTQVQFIENKMKDLKNEISTLYEEQQQSRSNEQFLKKIVKSLTRVYGYESIERVIESIDTEETYDAPSSKCHETNAYNRCSEDSGKYDARHKSYLQCARACRTPSINDDDVYSGKDYINTCEYESVPTGSVLKSCDKSRNQVSALASDLRMKKSNTPQELELRYIFNTDDSEPQIESGKSSDSATYRNWLVDFEKKKNWAEAFLGQTSNNCGNSHLRGGLELDDLYHRTDF